MGGADLCPLAPLHGLPFEETKLREILGPAVLLLTALDGLQDKETGFGAGADDYLTKPFEFRELLLRIRALARRGAAYGGLHAVLRVADLELDTDARTVTRAGQRIELTTREYSLLEYLMTNKGRTVSRIDIAEKVWDLHFDTNTNVIDVYINFLRKKIDKGFGQKLLHTVVGAGGLLLTFSYYVYVNTAQFRHHSFVERLARKAAVTRQIVALDDSIAGSMLASLPEQAEQVYTPAGRRLYASPGTDYAPSAGLLVRVRQRGQMSFTYQLPGHAHPKEGVALAYRRPDAEGQYVAIVTAYDQEGYAQQQMLFNSFLYGNLAAVALVAALGLFFATRALAPLNFLLRQLRADTARAQPFRLRPLNPRDEAGTLAAAFNDLLTRQEELVESQRAFISHASHELRTPLTTIKGWLETSLAYDSEVASLKKGIGLAVAGLDRLTALANGLLYLARLDSATPLDGQPVELVDVLLDVVRAHLSAPHQGPRRGRGARFWHRADAGPADYTAAPGATAAAAPAWRWHRGRGAATP
nr:two-component system sensor histidine kinase/response regulator, putative [Tanacetum cinerariifolium]